MVPKGQSQQLVLETCLTFHGTAAHWLLLCTASGASSANAEKSSTCDKKPFQIPWVTTGGWNQIISTVKTTHTDFHLGLACANRGTFFLHLQGKFVININEAGSKSSQLITKLSCKWEKPEVVHELHLRERQAAGYKQLMSFPPSQLGRAWEKSARHPAAGEVMLLPWSFCFPAAHGTAGRAGAHTPVFLWGHQPQWDTSPKRCGSSIYP